MLARLSSFLRYTLANEPTGEGDARAGGRDAEALSRDREDALRGPAAAAFPDRIRDDRRAAAVAAAPAADRKCDQICGDAGGEWRRHLDHGKPRGPARCGSRSPTMATGEGGRIQRQPINRRRPGEHSGPTGAGLWRRRTLRDQTERYEGASALSSKFHTRPETSSRMTIRTILVDDEPLATQGLQLRLEAHDDVEIVATAANGREAIRADQDPQARSRLPRHPDAGLRRLLGDPGPDGGRAAAVRLRHRLWRACAARVRGAGGRLSDEAGRRGPARRRRWTGSASASPRSAAPRKSSGFKEVLAEHRAGSGRGACRSRRRTRLAPTATRR